MSPEWTLTLAVTACAGMIVMQMPPSGTVLADPPAAAAWSWDRSHQCRLVLLPVIETDGISRLRIRNETAFPVRYRLVVRAADAAPVTRSVEAWPRMVLEVAVRAPATELAITAPDCRRLI